MTATSERWTDAAVKLLDDLYAAGFSSSDIARRLGEETGLSYSRNSVIGKIGRRKQIGLRRRTSPLGETIRNSNLSKDPVVRSVNAAREKARIKPSAISSFAGPGISTSDNVPAPDPGAVKRWDSTPPENANPKSIVALKYMGECKWPLAPSDDGVMMFCGAKSQDGCVYCGTHMRRSIGLSYVRPARPVQAVTG
jgi:hypothetical protein